MRKFGLTVSYGQLAVFDAELREPFNSWRDEHVAQGFAWRPGSVSFRMEQEEGRASVSVERAEEHQMRGDAGRAIAVPFRVPEHGILEIASIGDGRRTDMEPGEYRVIFQHGTMGNGEMWCELTFISVSAPVEAEILRAGADRALPEQLLMEAEPA